MKRCFIDVETTGLYPKKHGIWQLAALIIDYDRTVLDEIKLEMAPFPGKEFTDKAVELSGKTIEELQGLMPAKEAYLKFTSFLEKHVNKFDKLDKLGFVAYNSPFDMGHVRQWFLDAGDNYFGSFFVNEVCVMRKFNDYLCSGRVSPENWPKDRKLQTIAEWLEVVPKNPNWHDAMTDIKATANIYYTLEDL